MSKQRTVLDDNSMSRAVGDVFSAQAKSDAVRQRALPIGRGPIGDIAAAARTVVIANPGDDSISIADPAMLARHTHLLDGEPLAVVVAADRAVIATASESRDAISVVDLDSGTVTATFPLAFGVTALAVSPDGSRAYAGRAVGGRVDIAVLDLVGGHIGTIDIGSGPAAVIDAIRVDPSGRRLYVAVTDDDAGRLIIIDAEASRVCRVIAVGSPIRDIAHAGSAVYVLTSDRAVGGAVHVVDLSTHAVTDTVAVGGAPTQLVLSPDLARAYLVDYDRVAVLCTLRLEIVESLAVDARPSCVALDADGTRLYVADYAGTVTEFAVSSSIEELYTQFLATDPIGVDPPRLARARELQPVTA